MSDKPGRNDPCPCGSGKKYKKCCMLNDGYNSARDVREEIKDAIQDRVFSSLEEANVFAKSFMENRNNKPLEEFQGLSPRQMHRILDCPFDSPDVLSFNFNAVKSSDDVPVLKLMVLITEAIGEKGLKPTATGNLPREISKEIAKKYLSKEEYERRTRFRNFNSENDIADLQTARLIATIAGYIRICNGRFYLSKEYKELVDMNSWAVIYESLFKTYVQKFNWAYQRKTMETPFFQKAFAFTMYLLQKFGDKTHLADFYAELFIDAFPMLIEGMPQDENGVFGSMLKSDYNIQALYSFAEMFGFVKCKYDNYKLLISALPLLKSIVTFI